MIRYRRPAEVKILIGIFIILSAWNGLRFFQGVRFWDIFKEYQVDGGPLYIVVSGALWSLIGFLLVCVAWSRKPWAWGAMLGGLVVYGVWFGVDRFLLQRPHGNEIFELIFSFAVMIFILFLVFSKDIRDFYHGKSF